jgi:hypothetical protein
MSIISIRYPILLRMEILEYVEAWPSMRVAVSVDFKHSEGFVNYKEETWFACAEWDDFTKALNNFVLKEITLKNVDEYFQLKIMREDEFFVLKLKTKEPGIDRVFMDADFSFKLDNDALGQLRDSFNEFEKWW